MKWLIVLEYDKCAVVVRTVFSGMSIPIFIYRSFNALL